MTSTPDAGSRFFAMSPRQAPVRSNPVWLLIALAFVSIVFGAIAATGSPILALVSVGAIVGMAALAVPAGQFVIAVVVLSFFVVGQIFYFGGIGAAVWLPYGLGFVLLIKWLIAKIQIGATAEPIPILDWLAFLSLLAVAISVATNIPSALQALAGGKNLVGLWGVYFIVSAGLVNRRTIDSIWKIFYVALVFQIPLVLYQYLIVAPSRTRFGATIGGLEFDAVVGGFGGNPEGGGGSGSMAYFACLMVLYTLSMYRRGMLGIAAVLAVAASSLLLVGLAEVKVVIVILPLALLIVLGPDIRKRLVHFVFGTIVSLIVGLGVLSAYQEIHYRGTGMASKSLAESLEKTIHYNLDSEHINFRTGEMGRVAAVELWINDALLRDPAHALTGYGPGASRGRSVVGAGEIARRYPFLVDRSAATQLLWDVGLLGFLPYALVLVMGLTRAIRLSRLPDISPSESAIFEASAAGLAMMLAMLFYGRDPLEVPAIGVQTMIVLGWIAHRSSLLNSRPDHARGAGSSHVRND